MNASKTPALTDKELILVTAMRRHAESSTILQDGSVFGSVYLDNCRPTGWSGHAFAGVLGSLQVKGLYRPSGDPCFGEVLIVGG